MVIKVSALEVKNFWSYSATSREVNLYNDHTENKLQVRKLMLVTFEWRAIWRCNLHHRIFYWKVNPCTVKVSLSGIPYKQGEGESARKYDDKLLIQRKAN